MKFYIKNEKCIRISDFGELFEEDFICKHPVKIIQNLH